MSNNNDKLAAISSKRSERAKQRASFRKENALWLEMSSDIALCIHYYLRRTKLTQKDLADRMGVSASQVSKWMKGDENLTLETISKLQEALDAPIISIRRPYEFNQISDIEKPKETSTLSFSSVETESKANTSVSFSLSSVVA